MVFGRAPRLLAANVFLHAVVQLDASDLQFNHLNFMLAERQRLSRAELADAMKTGKRVHSTLFSCSLKKVAGGSGASVVVSKKIAKTAVLRNRVRRRVYALLRERALIPRSTHCVLFLKLGAMTAEREVMARELEQVLQKTVY